MKLSTMILPTGEYMLVASEVKHLPPPEALEGFRRMKEEAGATAVFLTSEEVEVDNAFVEEGVRRVEPPFPPIDRTTFLPRVELDGGSIVSMEFKGQVSPSFVDCMFGDTEEHVQRQGGENFMIKPELTENQIVADVDSGDRWFVPTQDEIYETHRRLVSDIDETTLKLLEDGAGVSPAGLVELTDEQKRALTEERGDPRAVPLEDDEVAELWKRSDTAAPCVIKRNSWGEGGHAWLQEPRIRDVPGYAYSPEGPVEREAVAKVHTDPDSDFGVADFPNLTVHDEMPTDLLTILGGLTDRVKAGRLDVQEALRRLAGGKDPE